MLNDGPSLIPIFSEVHVLIRYSTDTHKCGTFYTSYDGFGLLRYIISDWARSIDNYKSTTKYDINVVSSVISSPLKKKSIVSLSIEEEEHIIGTLATCEEVWFR